MVDNHSLGGIQQIFLIQAAALRAFFGVFQRGVVSRRRDGRARHPYPNTGLIHHLKHIAQASIGLAQQPAPAVVVLAHSQVHGGGTPLTELMVNPRGSHIVFFKTAIFLDPIFGYYE